MAFSFAHSPFHARITRSMAYCCMLLLLGLLAGCSKTETKNDEAKKDIPEKMAKQVPLAIDKAFLGMSLQNLKAAYPTASFEEVPVARYGISGSGKGTLVQQKADPLLFAWTMEGDDIVIGITILSPDIQVGQQVHIGMSAADFFLRYPQAPLSIDAKNDSVEYSVVQEKNFRVEFASSEASRVGLYGKAHKPGKSVKLRRPDAPITRISL